MENKNRPIILYAEDDDALRRTFGRFFASMFPDFELERFEDGNSLEARIHNLDINVGLIVTDNEMPGMTGLEIIRKYASQVDIPFIMFYGGDEKIGKKAVEYGAFGYVLKLDGGVSLNEMIGKALSRPTE